MAEPTNPELLTTSSFYYEPSTNMLWIWTGEKYLWFVIDTGGTDTFVPYTGATDDVDLGLHSLTGAGIVSMLNGHTITLGDNTITSSSGGVITFGAAGIISMANLQVTNAPELDNDVVRFVELGNYVDRTTNQNVGGIKTFTTDQVFNSNIVFGLAGSTTADTTHGSISLPSVPGGDRFRFTPVSGISKSSFDLIANSSQLRSYTMPSADGTLALVGDLSAYMPKTGGTFTGNVTIDNSHTLSGLSWSIPPSGNAILGHISMVSDTDYGQVVFTGGAFDPAYFDYGNHANHANDGKIHVGGGIYGGSSLPSIVTSADIAGYQPLLPNTTLKRTTVIYNIGDSMTAEGDYVARIQANLGTANYLVVNMGISGGWLFNMANRFGQVTNGATKFVIIRGGPNDLIGGQTGLQAIASLQSIITAANTASITPIIMSMSPFGTNVSWTAPIETERLVFNNAFATNAFTGTYLKVDADLILRDPSNVQNLNPIYTTDGLHQNTLGYQTLADATTTAITFTQNLTNSTIYFTAKSLTFDQDVSTNSNPVFGRPTAQSFTATGASNSSDGTPSILALAGANNNSAIIARVMLASQRYPLVRFQDLNGNDFFQTAFTGSTAGEFILTLKPLGDSTKGLLIKGNSPTYTANFMEVQDSTGTTLANWRFDGTIGTPGVFAESGSSHAALNLLSTGAVLIHQDADSNPVLDITNFNSAATGDFFRVKRNTTILGGWGWKGLGIGTTNHTSSFQITKGTTGLGTVSTTSGLNTVVGTNTDFTVRFKVGQTLTVNSETQTIATITDDSNMTISGTWTGTNTNAVYTHPSFSTFTANLNGNINLPQITGNGIVLYTTSAGLLSGVAAGNANQLLHGGTTPSWGAVDLSTAQVTGSLPAASVAGVTGTQGAIVVKATTTTLGEVAAVAAGSVLKSNGTGTSPVWGTANTQPHTIFTPGTGGTITMVNNKYNIVNPAGTIATLTINMPSSPANDDRVAIKFTQAVTTVTYASGTVLGGIASPTPGTLVTLVYDSATTTWY